MELKAPRPRVLIVDDNRMARTVMRDVVASMGLEYAEASSGEEAIRSVADIPVHLVLLDIVMPGMDGLETLRCLKQIKPDLLVIMSTVQREFETPVEAMRLGAFDYVTKPFQVPILETSIRRAIQHYEMIVERYELVRQLQEAKGYLEEEVVRRSGLAAVGSLASGVAHEFNNLIGAMLGYAELASRTEDRELTQQALEVIQRSCNRAKHITSNLLVFARRQHTTRQVCRLTEILDNTLALLERDFNKREIEVVKEFEGDHTVFCDPGQISQVIFNVLDNARQAMSGGGHLTIRIQSVANDEVIVVSDEGIGIPSDLLENVFEPFAARRNQTGTERIGLGLSVAKTIMDSHEGTIEIESEVDQGTTVTIRLPQKHG